MTDKNTAFLPISPDLVSVYPDEAVEREQERVTVCIAAICGEEDGKMVVCAADRMLTAGDVEFEPAVPKIIPVTSSIFFMLAGDSAVQAEILANILKQVKGSLPTEAEKYWSVKEMADLYVKWYIEAKTSLAEIRWLLPLNLNRESFITRQQELKEGFVDTIATRMLTDGLPKVQTIVAGIDSDGPHIYQINRDIADCYDRIGFAAIGSGADHARSEFMHAKHSLNTSAVNTIITAHAAKKRAEAAPGVGSDMDMILVGPNPGGSTPVSETSLRDLERIYKARVGREKRAREKAIRELETIVKKANS